MNLLFRFLALAGFLTAGAAALVAADVFEGKVSLAITANNGRPQALNYAIKGRQLRIDMNASGHDASSIMDMEKMEMLVLMPEQKMYMVMPIKKPVEEAMAKQGGSTAEIERTGKTETILGYKCEQVLVKDKGVVTELWVADKLGVFMGTGNGGGGMFGGKKGAGGAKWEEALKGKGGFPLRVISSDANGKQTYKMEATSIEPGPLPDMLFAPPAGYKKFSMPDLGGMNPFKQG